MGFDDWAKRRVNSPDAPRVRSAATVIPPPPGQQGHPLPPPPAGYTWAHHPTHGIIAVPFQGMPVQSPRQPQSVTPYAGNVSPFVQNGGNVPGSHVPTPVRTCELVKPGTRDTYAELLATVPEMAPRIDASNPAVAQELAALRSMPEYHDRGAMTQDAPTEAYPAHGAHAPISQVAPLK